MPPFQLVRSGDKVFAEAATVTRTLFVPDLEGNWRELRLRRSAGAHPGPGGIRHHRAPLSPLYAA